MKKLSTALLLASILTTAGAGPTTTGPSADQTMDALLNQPASAGRPVPAIPTGQATDATSGPGAVAPLPVVQVIREGTHLFNRTGRLNHSADGLVATITFDTDGKTMKDPPMIVLPNLKLMSMEGAIAAATKDVRFRVSGTVTEYKNRNYILIDKAVVVADVDQGL